MPKKTKAKRKTEKIITVVIYDCVVDELKGMPPGYLYEVEEYGETEE